MISKYAYQLYYDCVDFIVIPHTINFILTNICKELKLNTGILEESFNLSKSSVEIEIRGN